MIPYQLTTKSLKVPMTSLIFRYIIMDYIVPCDKCHLHGLYVTNANANDRHDALPTYMILNSSGEILLNVFDNRIALLVCLFNH